jgi:4-hydroxybenzoate polyprenyltransferase
MEDHLSMDGEHERRRRLARQNEELRKTMRLLVIGSLVSAVVLAWLILVTTGAPVFVALIVAFLYLLLDAIAISVIWFAYQRR